MNSMKLKAGLAVAIAVVATGLGASATASNVTKIPDGVYRANVSEAFLRAAGIPAREAADNGGIQTLIFKGNRWTNHTMSRFHPPDCSGGLSYSATRVTLTADRGPQCGTAAGGRLFSARWSFKQGELRFTAIQPPDLFNRTAWGGKPWKKIG